MKRIGFGLFPCRKGRETGIVTRCVGKARRDNGDNGLIDSRAPSGPIVDREPNQMMQAFLAPFLFLIIKI